MPRKRKEINVTSTSAMMYCHTHLLSLPSPSLPSPSSCPNLRSHVPHVHVYPNHSHRDSHLHPTHHLRSKSHHLPRATCSLFSLLSLLLLPTVITASSSSTGPFYSPGDPISPIAHHHLGHHHSHTHLTHSTNSNGDGNIVSTLTTTSRDRNFTHITIDPASGQVYVGGTNWLYQLNSDLSVGHSLRTGPVEDSIECSPTDCASIDPSKVKVTNNVNKVLVIDGSSPTGKNMIISCGSVHQGSCRRHSVDDIRVMDPMVGVPVAANDDNSSTIAFVSMAKYPGSSPHPVLYVGATNTRLGAYRDYVPAISSRSLESGPRLFNIIEKSFTDAARVDIEYHLRDYFLVRYVHGFSHHEFIYFLQIQRKSHFRTLEELGYVTRIARVCASDPGYHTYTEVTVSCVGPDGTDYNLLQDGVTTRVGVNLARSYGLTEEEEVFIGTFSPSAGHSMTPSTGSAVCIIPMRDIERAFSDNIGLCFNGSVEARNMDYIAGSVNQCPEPRKSTTSSSLGFCHEAIKLNGSLPLTVRSHLLFPGDSLTAIVSAITGPHTVLFTGSKQGVITKVLVSSMTKSHTFDQVTIEEGAPILSDLHLDADQGHLIAATPYTISLIRLESCSRHDSCSGCVSSHNPYCGWCSLLNRCSSMSECLDSSSSSNQNFSSKNLSSRTAIPFPSGPKSLLSISSSLSSSSSSLSSSLSPSSPSSRWLSLDGQCITFTHVNPSSVPLTSHVQTLDLYIKSLPSLPRGAHYMCVFSSSLMSKHMSAKITRFGLSCPTPASTERPVLPSGAESVSMTLSVRSTLSDVPFLAKPFSFYSCSIHRTCKSCVQSPFPCNWCVRDSICSDNVSSCGPERWKVISSDASKEPDTVRGIDYCPSFKLDKDILIPDGVRREITLDVRNLMSNTVSKSTSASNGLECILDVEGARAKVAARIHGNQIICSAASYSYQGNVPSMSASLEVTQNGEGLLDGVNITLYKCHQFAAYIGEGTTAHDVHQDCSLCSNSDNRYGCVWCSGGCNFIDTCSSVPDMNCPPPKITSFHPTSGPIEGGTTVTINGFNLGSTAGDIEDNILVAGLPCRLSEYTPSVRIVCQTSPSSSGAASGHILISSRAGVGQSMDKFHYKEVKVTSVFPSNGPYVGGTTLSVRGVNVNIGSHMDIFLDDQRCRLLNRTLNPNEVTCKTPSSPVIKKSDGEVHVVSNLFLKVDNGKFNLPHPFTFMSDPLVFNMDPLESYISGGRFITVMGSGFSTVDTITFIVYSIQTLQPVNSSSCSILSDSSLLCPSPSINDEWSSKENRLHRNQQDITPSVPSNYALSSSSYLNQLRLGVTFSFSDSKPKIRPEVKWTLKYLPDPKIFLLPSTSASGSISSAPSNPLQSDGSLDASAVKVFTGDDLVMEGENLKLAATESEVTVTVGGKSCNITSFTMNQLICSPPSLPESNSFFLPFVSSVVSTSETKEPVVVTMGMHLKYHLGYLKYTPSKDVRFGFIPGHVSGWIITLCIAFMVIISSYTIIKVVMSRSSSGRFRSGRSKDPNVTSPPIIPFNSTNNKPLPLIPLHHVPPPDLMSLFNTTSTNGGKSGSNQDLNAIYSEIDNYGVVEGTSNQKSSNRMNVNLNHLSNGLTTGSTFKSSIGSADSTSTSSGVTNPLLPNGSGQPPRYPPFFTFNTIGRSGRNPYVMHDTMGRPPDTIINTGGNTYTVFSFDKLTSNPVNSNTLNTRNKGFTLKPLNGPNDRFV